MASEGGQKKEWHISKKETKSSAVSEVGEGGGGRLRREEKMLKCL